MAHTEILLRVRDHAGGQSRGEDGDPEVVVRYCEIAMKRAEMWAGWATRAPFKGEPRPNGRLRPYCRRRFRYENRRLNKFEYEQRDLITDEVTLFSSDRVDLPAYMRNLMSNPKHLVFGASGSEIWYGNALPATNQVADRIWTAIENRTQQSRPTRFRFPWSRFERRNMLIVPVEDMTLKQKTDALEPLFSNWDEATAEGSGVALEVARARRRRIRWSNKLSELGVTAAQVRDKARELDPGERTPLALLGLLERKDA